MKVLHIAYCIEPHKHVNYLYDSRTNKKRVTKEVEIPTNKETSTQNPLIMCYDLNVLFMFRSTDMRTSLNLSLRCRLEQLKWINTFQMPINAPFHSMYYLAYFGIFWSVEIPIIIRFGCLLCNEI